MTPLDPLEMLLAHQAWREHQVHEDQFTHLMPFTPQQLASFGFHYYRVFESGDVWAVSPFSISNGRLFIDLNDNGYRDFYCFCDYETALKALQEFDPKTMKEPTGWHRHGGSGRRREGGDPGKETIWW